MLLQQTLWQLGRLPGFKIGRRELRFLDGLRNGEM
jgi:hypothetical protein